MNRPKPPPVNLDKYCEGRSRNYVSYEDGARMYGMTYWGFVRLCQEIGANIPLRKTLELGRVDSDEHYLSQPPAGIILMAEADNALYESGESFACVNAVMEVYKLIGETFVNIKGYTNEKRNARLNSFLEMVDKYQRENAKDPNAKSFLSKDTVKAEEKVVPFKKGVQAPKKS